MEVSQVSGPSVEGSNTRQVQDRIWLHAWSSSEIRENASRWSLAGDAGVLLALESMSENLLRKASAMQRNIDETVHALKSTQTRVENCLNDFLNLANSQFIENRVYDDEEAPNENSSKIEETEKPTLSNAEAQEKALQRYTEALQIGLNVLQTHFQQIDPKLFDDKDSNGDDGDGQSRIYNEPTLEPKNFYDLRPLPALIGSVEFISDEFIGLKVYRDEKIPERSPTISERSPTISSTSSSDSETSKKAKPIIPVIPPAGESEQVINPVHDSLDSDDDPFGPDLSRTDYNPNPPHRPPPPAPNPINIPKKPDPQKYSTDSNDSGSDDDGFFDDKKKTPVKQDDEPKGTTKSDSEIGGETETEPAPPPKRDMLSELQQRIREKAEKNNQGGTRDANDVESHDRQKNPVPPPSVKEKIETNPTNRKNTTVKPIKPSQSPITSDDDDDYDKGFSSRIIPKQHQGFPPNTKPSSDEDSDDLFKSIGKERSNDKETSITRSGATTNSAKNNNNQDKATSSHAKTTGRDPLGIKNSSSNNLSKVASTVESSDDDDSKSGTNTSNKIVPQQLSNTNTNPVKTQLLDTSSDDELFEVKKFKTNSTDMTKTPSKSGRGQISFLPDNDSDGDSYKVKTPVSESSQPLETQQSVRQINPLALDGNKKTSVKELAFGLNIPTGAFKPGGPGKMKTTKAVEDPVERAESNAEPNVFQTTPKSTSSVLPDDDDDDDKTLPTKKPFIPTFNRKKILTSSSDSDSDEDNNIPPIQKKPASNTTSSFPKKPVESAATSDDFLDALPTVKPIDDKSITDIQKYRTTLRAAKRTPRQRTSRTPGAVATNDDDLFGISNTDTNVSTTSIPKPEPIRSTTSPKPSSNKVVVDDDDDDEFFGTTGPKPSKAQPASKVEPANQKPTVNTVARRQNDDDDDDLFADTLRKPTPNQLTSKLQPPKPSGNDTQDDPVISDGASPTPTVTQPALTKKTSVLDNDDHSFSGVATRTAVQQPETNKKKTKLIDEEDDLFGTTPSKTNVSQASAKNETTTQKPLRSPTLDDGDLFGGTASKTNTPKAAASSTNSGMSEGSGASKSVPAASATSTLISTKEKKKFSIFDSDDSDIDALLFGSSKKKTPSATSKTENKTSRNIASILDDDFLASKPKKKNDLDSIFDDEKPSKNKAKKDWSLLDGTGDDIFNTVSSSAKSTENTKPKSTSSKSTLKTDIDDIFDDPLSVSSKKK